MLVPVIKVLLILGLVAGAAGGTAVAADASVPGDLLYSLDLALEDLQLALIVDPATQVDLQIRRLDERMEEIAQLIERGEEVDGATVARLHHHLTVCLDLIAELDAPEVTQKIERLQATVQAQMQLLSLLEKEIGNEASRQALEQAVQLMEEVQTMLEEGLEDPATFRPHLPLPVVPPIGTPVLPTLEPSVVPTIPSVVPPIEIPVLPTLEPPPPLPTPPATPPTPIIVIPQPPRTPPVPTPGSTPEPPPVPTMPTVFPTPPGGWTHPPTPTCFPSP
ncbi:MAG TPA: hypothetical protein G4O00_11730 [Thermoflexia bacterium]|nr:hypothetical protein [Thermoflexia bacterium]